jgi:phosphoglycolate phosphatase
MEEKRIIIFDWDGTILDSTEIGFRKIEQTLVNLDLPILPREILRKNWGMKAENLFKFICQEIGVNQINSKDFYLAYRQIEGGYSVNEEMVKSLDRLKEAGFLIGLLTSRTNEGWLKSCKMINFDHKRFDFIQTATHYYHHKPSGRVFGPIVNWARTHDYQPEQIIYFGDTIAFDFLAAKNSSPAIDFVGIVSGVNTYKEFRLAGLAEDKIIPSFEQVPMFLNKLIEKKIKV